jgi:cell division protease FtsH
MIRQVQEGGIKRVDIAQNKTEMRAYTEDDFPIQVVLPEDTDVLSFLLENGVDIQVLRPHVANDVPNLLVMAMQIGIFVIMVRLALSMGAGAGNNMLKGIGASQAKLDEEPQTGVTFDDVAGAENAKQDLMEVVDFLKTPEKYFELGAKMPKGVLLVGPPGTGKTKLARAVAGEAGVPFFSCSGSEFIEMFVGVGASRVRDLFKRAQEKAPCIIFIDEIDAIGKQRGNGAFGGGGNDERDQTINQLLTLMDGFAPSTGVVVLAATNRPDILDDALLRPGRFDRQVRVDLPDLQGRTEILKIHARNKPISSDVSLESFARITVGFSGADLENLCNEASIYAARRNSKQIETTDFDKALEKLTIGEERRTALVSEEVRKIVAYHEAGHALLGMVLCDFDKIRKVSIVPRGSTGGATYFEPQEDRIDMNLVTREYLENQIMVSLGGRIAEELVFGKKRVTTGASGDFMQVASLAQQMVVQFGMSQTLAPMYLGECDGISSDIDVEIQDIVNTLYERAVDLMKSYEPQLHKLAQELLQKETLHEEDLDKYAAELRVACHSSKIEESV